MTLAGFLAIDAMNLKSSLTIGFVRRTGRIASVPVGEALLTDRVVEAILDRGLIPLMSSKYGNEIRVPRFQSVADPPVPLEFPGE